MKVKRIGWLAVAIVAASCARSHHGARSLSASVDGGSTPVSPPAYAPVPPAVDCVALYQECEPAGAQCCDGYCGDTGYGMLRCTPRSPNGSWCLAADECESRSCVANICGPAVAPPPPSTTARADGEACAAPAECASRLCADRICRSTTCRETSAECVQNAECCTGFCTNDGVWSYAPGACTPLLHTAEPCVTDAWCESGRCSDGRCSP